jgi:hypothetical protein
MNYPNRIAPPPTYEQAIAQDNQSRINHSSRITDTNFDVPRQTVNTRQITSQQDNSQSNPVLLSSSDIARNDTSNENFVNDLLSMPLEDILNLQRKIQNNLNEYPMPCMQITAFQLNICLDNALQLYDLTKTEKQVLTDIIAELNFLSPNYPYKKSLIITYKILTVLSFLEYNFKLLSLYDVSIKNSLIQDLKSKRCYYDPIKIANRSEIVETFTSSCTLMDIQNLPWSKMLENSTAFEDAMNKIYVNNVFSLKDDCFFHPHKDILKRIDTISTLRTGDILIPYTENLTISQLNRLWALPINLIRCSTESFINNKLIPDVSTIYIHYLMPNVLFEKDLKLVCQKEKSFINSIQIFNFIHDLYENRELIDSKFYNFNAIEIALFICLNENIKPNKDFFLSIDNVFERVFKSSFYVSHTVFPKQYYNLRSIDIKNAAWFLFKLKTYLNDNPLDISLYLIEKDITNGIQNTEVVKRNPQEDSKLINIDASDPVAERQKIAVIVRKNQKKLIENGINPSKIVNILFILDSQYPEIREVIPPLHEFNMHVKEQKWLECYINCSRGEDDPKKIIKATIKQFKKT